MDNLPVPAEFGGGGYSDGNNAINQWIGSSICTNPKTGELYNTQYWKSYKERNMTQMRRDWEKKYNADNATDYMAKNNALVVSPSVSVSLPSDSADISVIRNSVNHSVCDASWRMIFAADDKAFDKMWDEMVTELKGFGFDDLYKFDVEKHTIEVNAKLAAMK
jgi:multiple sugar transport system substrate-binding protein/putative aldouronate transport system substrate-binding protein